MQQPRSACFGKASFLPATLGCLTLPTSSPIMSAPVNTRSLVLKILFVLLGLTMLTRLFFLQVADDKYKIMANDITIFRKVVYPPRGVIYDTKGKVICRNESIYDLMMTAEQVPKDADTATLCQILGIAPEAYRKMYEKAKWMNGPKRPGVFMSFLTPEQTARLQEASTDFPGFQLVERSIRSYPYPIAGNILGFTGEVSPAMLKRERFASYSQGDYVGLDGLELWYEEVLRGRRGVHFFQRDNFNRPRDPYRAGALDTMEEAGRSLELYMDADLQAYGEKLLQGKLGSVVAIDPATGGILAMVSSPGYDPNLLRGAERSRNFSKLYSMATKPLFNRAIKASYTPGSTQKPLTGLIALDEGAITPAFGYPCFGGYGACGKFIRCTHSGGGHAGNLRLALANSCNAYFVHIYRLSVDMKKWGGVHNGLQQWYRHMFAMGFGRRTGIDLPYEVTGTLFDSTQYNRMYRGQWNSCTNLFIGMGQGELTATPLQMANAMAIIANRGFYYRPHLVKSIGGNPRDSVLRPFLQKIIPAQVADTDYAIIGLGMMDVVNHGTGRVAQLPNVEVCAKTGTAENYAIINGQRVKLKDHSVFVAFAPRVNPKIAIAVTVENAGYGSTWAGPVASLMIEKYLFDTIANNRKALEERMFNGTTITAQVYAIDSSQRRMDREREATRTQRRFVRDSTVAARDSAYIRFWMKQYIFTQEKRKANAR